MTSTPAAGGALFARDMLLPQGWARDVRLVWDAAGSITRVEVGGTATADDARAAGPVIPGLPNLHSHAFQRAMAGLTEFRSERQDSFWSWRDLMYRFAGRLGPVEMEAIATWLYVEMIESGYTGVCEFQYVHHQPDGRPYADDATLCRALLAAARRAGIGFTLLPVLYQASGFGGAAPTEGQRRFIRSTDSMLGLLDALRPECEAQGARLGLAPHSLRAVPAAALAEAVAGLHAKDASAPIHIHIAEQTREVEECLAATGQRPVEWLLDHADPDARWCLVHATHMTPTECARAARSGAVAGLCPTTEANLGDGLFDFEGWRAAGGRFGVGSDSHATVNAAEEILWLEYGQRLSLRRRNVGATAQQGQVAAALLSACVAGGAQASGRAVAGLAIGQQADLVVLDPGHVALAGLPAPEQLSAHVFASQRSSAIAEVRVAGQVRVARGRHPLHDEAAHSFIAARQRLLEDS